MRTGYGQTVWTVQDFIADNELYPNAVKYRSRKKAGNEALASGSTHIRGYCFHNGAQIDVVYRHGSPDELSETIQE